MATKALSADEVFKTVRDALQSELDIDPNSDDSFAEIPTHHKIVFSKGSQVFVISISEGSGG